MAKTMITIESEKSVTTAYEIKKLIQEIGNSGSIPRKLDLIEKESFCQVGKEWERSFYYLIIDGNIGNYAEPLIKELEKLTAGKVMRVVSVIKMG